MYLQYFSVGSHYVLHVIVFDIFFLILQIELGCQLSLEELAMEVQQSFCLDAIIAL